MMVFLAWLKEQLWLVAGAGAGAAWLINFIWTNIVTPASAPVIINVGLSMGLDPTTNGKGFVSTSIKPVAIAKLTVTVENKSTAKSILIKYLFWIAYMECKS